MGLLGIIGYILWATQWRTPAATPLPTLAATVALNVVPSSSTPTVTVPTPSSTPTPSVTPLPPTPTFMSPTAITPTQTLTPTITPSPTPFQPLLTPGNPQPYLTTFRLVTFYGNPLGPDLGILGESPPETMLAQLRGVADLYQDLSPDHYVVPTFHIVSTVADPFPGEDGNYNHWLSTNTLDTWIDWAREENVAVILDIQPGRGDIQLEFNRIKHYLREPHVHLALDPEFVMADDEVPGVVIGQLYASQINPIQEELEKIALEIGLNRVLILHQFEPGMLPNKAAIADYPHVEVVIDADGFGSPQGKIADYDSYAAGPAFEFGGFKLFFGWDVPVMTPGEVMSLLPPPAIIVYQ